MSRPIPTRALPCFLLLTIRLAAADPPAPRFLLPPVAEPLRYTIDLTIMEVAIKWSGDPAWARNVAAVLGVDTRTTLAMIVDADLKRQGGATEA